MLPPASYAAARARAEWIEKARVEQITPDGDWSTWLILAGRGWGKTRTGAEDVAYYGFRNSGSRIHIIAPTYSDARDTCVEGESGLLNILAPELIETWNRSLGELILTNGSRYKLFSADEPDRLRGPQAHRAWCDELAAWTKPDTWDQMLFGLRLGQNPQVVVTTTPRPTPLVRRIAQDARTRLTRGRTRDNASNLAPSALAQLEAKYAGTRLGRQELEAEILDDVPGALWTRAMVDEARKPVTVPTMQRVVVAIDPSGTKGDESGDSIGIVVAGKGTDGRAYVLADRTCRLSPAGWGRIAVEAYHEFQADRIVAERNFGGAMVEHVIRTADPRVAYAEVTASRGKAVRAEPVAALYEQCVALGTLIACERGQMPVECVRPGDLVWTRMGLKPVLWAGQTGIHETIEIKVDGRSLRLTENHPVLTTDGWVRAGQLARKERSVFAWQSNANFVPRRLVSAKDERSADHAAHSAGAVFNLHVADQHEYVANGVLVHNCRVSHAPGMPELEDQMCQMASDGYLGEGSPDRLDAMVWAMTDLMLEGRAQPVVIPSAFATWAAQPAGRRW